MKNILIISGHPNLSQSVANRTILEEVAKALPNVKIRKLDELYPNTQIDVATEQQALLDADVIVWQFPLHWYSMPALLKKYLDEVFVHGFAHGSTAKLKGKTLQISFTTGASGAEYAEGRAMNFPMEAFFPAFQQTANLCGLQFAEPIYSSGLMYVEGLSSAEDLARVQAESTAHAQRLIQRLEQL